MPNRLQLSDLAEPVASRAYARPSPHPCSFRDRHAAALLEKLGVYASRKAWLEKTKSFSCGDIQQRECVNTCAWIDGRVLKLLKQNPKAKGIEINGGLSTRFHRLSSLLDWPRFTWLSINTHDVDAILQTAFPSLDNYLSIVSSQPLADFHRLIDWQAPDANILIFGEDNAIRRWPRFETLLKNIQDVLETNTNACDVIVRHCIPDLIPQIQRSNLRFTVLEEKQCCQPRFLTRLRTLFFWRKSFALSNCCHLRLEIPR